MVEAGEVQGSIIPLGSPSCNYLKFASNLAKEDPYSDRSL